MAATPVDMHIHDTYFIVAHIHYVLFGGSTFGIFAGIYYWFPRATGRVMNETLGRIHFAGSLICMNLIFMPMFVQGLAGVNRRLWDGGAQYAHAQDVLYLNIPMSHAAFALAFFQLFFIINLFVSIKAGRTVKSNPWDSTTLEWTDGHGRLRVYRDPYDYSVPGAATDFTPQHQPADAR